MISEAISFLDCSFLLLDNIDGGELCFVKVAARGFIYFN